MGGVEVGGRFRVEGANVYLWLIHVDIWQKQTQYYKAIILQLKINLNFKNLQFKKGEIWGEELNQELGINIHTLLHIK